MENTGNFMDAQDTLIVKGQENSVTLNNSNDFFVVMFNKKMKALEGMRFLQQEAEKHIERIIAEV